MCIDESGKKDAPGEIHASRAGRWMPAAPPSVHRDDPAVVDDDGAVWTEQSRTDIEPLSSLEDERRVGWCGRGRAEEKSDRCPRPGEILHH